MAHNFPLGSVVVNFGLTALVVGHFRTADGAPSVHDGHPILRELSADRRRFVGAGTWLADPRKCEAVPNPAYAPAAAGRGRAATEPVCEHGYARACGGCQ